MSEYEGGTGKVRAWGETLLRDPWDSVNMRDRNLCDQQVGENSGMADGGGMYNVNHVWAAPFPCATGKNDSVPCMCI